MLVLTLSSLLRLVSYFFLRWLPGALFPKIVLTLYILYLSSVIGIRRHRRSSRLYQCLGAYGSCLANAVNIGINTILTLCVVDAAIGDWLMHDYQELEFSKVGYVTQTSAKLSIRSPLYKSFGVCYIPAHGSNNSVPAACTNVDVDDSLVNSDHVYTMTLLSLMPGTTYNYSAIFPRDLVGASVESILSRGSNSFVTAPAVESKWSFLASSCIIPNFPYNPINRNHFHGWEELYETELKDQMVFERPRWMIFLGDFIYCW